MSRHRLALLLLLLLLLFEQLSHELVVLLSVLVLVLHARVARYQGLPIGTNLDLLLLHLMPYGLLLLHLLVLMMARHGEAGIGIAPVMIIATSPASLETGGLPDLALGRLGGRGNVRLGHTAASRKLACRLLVNLAREARRLLHMAIVLGGEMRRLGTLVMVIHGAVDRP